MTDLFPELIPPPPTRKPPRVLMRISETDIGHTGETDGPVNVKLFCPKETCHHETGWLRFDSAAQAKDQQAPFTVNANEASTLFAVLVRQLLLDDLRFHDARATALTMLAKKVDVMTLAKISRHRDLKILLNTYYRATAEEIARKI